MIYTKPEVTSALFLHITTKQAKEFNMLSKAAHETWVTKYASRFEALSNVDAFDENAKHFPEFNVITKITLGIIDPITLKTTLVPIEGTEKEILKQLSDALIAKEKVKSFKVAGFNIINYQLPMLTKKLINHSIEIPRAINLHGKKPWEVNAIDIMRDYQGNMYGDISIELMAEQLGITPNADALTTVTDMAIKMTS